MTFAGPSVPTERQLCPTRLTSIAVCMFGSVSMWIRQWSTVGQLVTCCRPYPNSLRQVVLKCISAMNSCMLVLANCGLARNVWLLVNLLLT